MGSNKRSMYSYKFKDPKLDSLQELVSQLHPVYKINFGKDYGNLLSLLNKEAGPLVLLTLAQFYDSPMRCFTFQDFQIAPMLEEFKHLAGIPIKNKLPFMGVEGTLEHEVIVAALHMHKKEVIVNMGVKGNTKGFPLNFLIERAYTLLEAQSWEAFYATISLAIYGIVLFLNFDDFVDMTSIGILLTKNLVSSLLADVGPFVDQKDASWPQRLGSLRFSDISWYSREYDGTETISSCGGFPNIPLIGTRGCINANPVLSMRQLGYPMEEPPEEKFLEAFLLHDLGVENPTLFARIKKAWEKVNRKGMVDLGKNNCITKEPYFQWIKERVRSIKMPFKIETYGPLPEPKPIHLPIEEAEGLRASLEKLTKENEELLNNLHLVTNEKN
ncbi:uncharacterized protein LOC127081508 [Lathyrus oleraceus]|uniref:uncharacterized protein LOC127081508 n=1 Tax=Pisum sativum TaxID=3888 RepID=UPI0021D381ED|nr:uncharacterized protein LOC127081508 [Pisum sativum]